jgi:hypothetical protein
MYICIFGITVKLPSFAQQLRFNVLVDHVLLLDREEGFGG